MTFKLRHPTLTEQQTQQACLKFLEADRRVAEVWRSSNVVRTDDKGVPYKANTDSRGNLVTVCDISGYFVTGHHLAIEVKEHQGKWRSQETFELLVTQRNLLLFNADGLNRFDKSERGRLLRQWLHITRVERAGGLGACVWSLDMCMSLVDAWWERTHA